jgi:hypothetical protein
MADPHKAGAILEFLIERVEGLETDDMAAYGQENTCLDYSIKDKEEECID